MDIEQVYEPPQLPLDLGQPQAPAPPPLPNELSEATLRAYASDARHFERWCEAVGRCAFPAEVPTIIEYLKTLGSTTPTYRRTDTRTHRLSTIRRRLHGIAYEHTQRALADPTDDPAITRAINALGKRRDRAPAPKAAAVACDLERILSAMQLSPDPTTGAILRRYRDRALFSVLYAGALKKSEARTLDHANITWFADCVRLVVGATNEAAAMRPVFILRTRNKALCPMRALALWITASALTDGPVFRAVTDAGALGSTALSSAQFARLYERRVQAAGLDPNGSYSPHSLRQGAVVELDRAGVSIEDIMRLTGHKEIEHAMRIVNRGRALAQHPGRFLGLD